jgi:hypothetical protein
MSLCGNFNPNGGKKHDFPKISGERGSIRLPPAISRRSADFRHFPELYGAFFTALPQKTGLSA